MRNALVLAVIFFISMQSCTAPSVSHDTGYEHGKFNVKTRYAWTASEPIIAPKPEKGRNVISAKDPSVVFYDGKWHVFYTTCDDKGIWSMQFISFKDWKDAKKSKAYPKDKNPNLQGYHCAPHVFYFTPQKKWYMVFQSGQPQYCTNDDIKNHDGWTKPVDFFKKAPQGLEKGQWGPEWLDFHCIGDDEYMYLFFTGDNGRFYRSRTKIGDFPEKMSDPVMVLYDKDRRNIYEGSCTYRIKGQNKYLTIIEAANGDSWDRYYRSFIADSLDGEWKEQAGSWEEPFAGLMNVKFENSVEPWTRDISHGELIRAGYDEKMEIDMENLQMLFQGRDPASNGLPYHMLPYRIGILKLKMEK